MDYDEFYKCNQRGKGFRIYNRAVTTFEEKVLFLRRSSAHENGESTDIITAPKVGTRNNAEEKRSISSDSSGLGVKRKVAGNVEDGDSTKESQISEKRMKDESNDPDANISTGEEGKTSLEDSPFSNDLLLRTIFANLNVEDLKSCRQVNSLWNIEATKILLKRDCLLPIQISDITATINATAEYKLPTALQDFRNICNNSRLFPSTSFAVRNDKVGLNEVIFFLENGHLVKSFCFDLEDTTSAEDEATAADIVLLAGCFPNLSTLRFVCVHDEPTHPLSLVAIQYVPDLKNLQTFEIIDSFPAYIISVILKKASNLRFIYLRTSEPPSSCYPDYLDKFMRLGNVIPRLKNIQFAFSEETFKVYERVLQQEPRLASIEGISIVHPSWNLAAARPILMTFLQQCSESLTEILELNSYQDLLLVGFPVFPNVKRLGIRLQPLSLGASLAQVFPNLVKVEVEFWYENRPEEIPPESMSPLLSVRHLQVKYEERWMLDIWVKTVCSLFPNVTSAKFCNPISDSAYEFIWTLSALQDLHLVLGPRLPSYQFSTLDSAFTGFTFEVAKQLYETIDAYNFSLSSEEIESYRVKPSIVDLKELRKLFLRLLDATDDDSDVADVNGENDTFGQKNMQVIFDRGDENCKALLQVDREIILSCITKRFGFDLCPQLQSNVSVGFTYYTKLGSNDNKNGNGQ